MNQADNLNRSIQKKYFLYFSILIFIGSVGQAFQQYFLLSQQNFSRVIHTAGHQQILLEKLTNKVLLETEFQSINNIYQEILENHQTLKDGSKEVPKALNSSIKAKYIELDPMLLKLGKVLECHQKNCKKYQNIKTTLSLFVDQLLSKMEALLIENELHISRQIRRQAFIDFSVFLGVLIPFIIILRSIVYPIKNKFINKIKEFEKERERNNSIEKAAKIGTWEIDIYGAKTFWSDEVYRIHGLKKDTVITRSIAIEFYPEHERERLLGYFKKSIQNKESFDERFEISKKDNTSKWVRIMGEPTVDSQGKVTHIVGVLQDITRLISQEKQIKSTDELFKLAKQGAKIGIWNWDIKKDTIFYDKAWGELLGINITEDMMRLETWKDRVHPEDLDRCYADIRKYMKRKDGNYENIHRMKHANGGWIYILNRGRMTHFNKEGRAAGFIGTTQDITETVKAQNEQKLILKSLNLGIWKWDITNDHLHWDDSLYELYGHTSAYFDSNYKAWQEIIVPEDRSQFFSNLDLALEGKKELDTTFQILTKNKEKKHIGTRAVVERDSSNKATSIFGINWDKTQEVSASFKLEEQRKISQHNAKLANIGEMAAGVGHEINNPLSIIKGYLSILLSEKEQGKDYGKLIKISQATERIEHIVAGLRQFVRSTDNDQEIISIPSLLTTTVNMMGELYKKEGISLSYKNLSDATVDYFAIGNLGRVQQIIVNLITNAKDATKNSKEPLISITSQFDEKFISISVKDNGEGIPKEVQGRIFDPFFTTKDVNKGTGIGLSLAHSIVKEHGGDISFNSSSNEGTEFILNLPRSKESNTTVKKETLKQTDKKTFQELSILLVDDEEDLLEIVSEMLKELGITVQVALNGEEALKLYNSKPEEYDIIITDMQMPLMDGLQFTREVRKMKTQKSPKIIVATGGVNIDIKDKQSELNKLVDEYLFKPFTFKKLEEVIANLNS